MCIYNVYRTEALQTMKILEKILRFTNILPPQVFFSETLKQFELMFLNSFSISSTHVTSLQGWFTNKKSPCFFSEKKDQQTRMEQKSSAGAKKCVPPKKGRRVTWKIRQDFGSVVSSFAKSLAV